MTAAKASSCLGDPGSLTAHSISSAEHQLLESCRETFLPSTHLEIIKEIRFIGLFLNICSSDPSFLIRTGIYDEDMVNMVMRLFKQSAKV